MTLPTPSVLTPYHSSMGTSVSQLVLSRQFGPSVALKKATNPSRSEVVAGGTVPRPLMVSVKLPP